MIRWIPIMLLAAVMAGFVYVAIGRATDQLIRTQERVITTRHGQTIDCRVDRYEDGSIYLNDCNAVQVP